MANRRYHDYLAEDGDYSARRRSPREDDDTLEDEGLPKDPWETEERAELPPQRDRRRAGTGFNWNELPVWTGVAILLFVVAIGGGLWLMTRNEEGATSAGMRTPTAGTETPGAPGSATTPGGPTPIIAGNTPVPPTPDHVAVGVRVRITGTGTDKLRVRAGPGTDNATLLIVTDGTEFKVLEGPQTQGGYAWWRIEAADGTVGWAVEQFLQPIGQ